MNDRDRSCEACQKRPGAKVDTDGNLLCLRCYNGIIDPIVNKGPRVGRNDRCLCGSGKKVKVCCHRLKDMR